MKAVSCELAVIGRTGVTGCMSVMPMTKGFDVAIYDELKPEGLFRSFRKGELVHADKCVQVGNYPGWVLDLLEGVESIT